MPSNLPSGKSRPVHMGRNLRHVRELLGVSQVALAEAAGFTQQNLSKHENSPRLTAKVLNRLAEALGVFTTTIRDFDAQSALFGPHHNQTLLIIAELQERQRQYLMQEEAIGKKRIQLLEQALHELQLLNKNMTISQEQYMKQTFK